MKKFLAARDCWQHAGRPLRTAAAQFPASAKANMRKRARRSLTRTERGAMRTCFEQKDVR